MRFPTPHSRKENFLYNSEQAKKQTENEQKDWKSNGGQSMSKERRRGYDSLSDADKGYYDDMYKDLPKEVVNILMQTHPLMGRNDDPEATAYRTRRPQRDDLDEIREARMQRVGSEIDEISNAPEQEGDPTKYVSRRSRYAEAVQEDTYTSAPRGNTMNEDDYEDEIQYVSVMPRSRRSNARIMEEITIRTAPETTSGSIREDEAYEEMSQTSYSRRRYEDIDFERRDKDGHLDNLYSRSGYDEEDEYRGTTSKLPYIIGIAGLLLIIVLIFRTVSLGSQLQDAKNQITQNESYKEKYEEIQLEKMQLEEQLEGKTAADDSKEEKEPEKEEKPKEEKQESTGSGTTEEYTIVAGDTLWKIAEKTLGNGAEYQKILDANGMKESDNLKIGAKLKIPK